MKTLIPLIAILLVLAACTVPSAPQQNASKPTLKANLSVDDVINEFDALDAQYNTTWKQEQIPKNVIKTSALKPWTERTLALKNITEKDTLASELIEARLDMISAETAVYLALRVGEKGVVPYMIENGNVTVEKLNCTNIKEIAEVTRLFQISFHNWMDFSSHMDKVLEDDIAVREKLGINKNRMPFYQSGFQEAGKKIKATVAAAKEQCGATIKVEPEPDMPKVPQGAVAGS